MIRKLIDLILSESAELPAEKYYRRLLAEPLRAGVLTIEDARRDYQAAHRSYRSYIRAGED